MWQPRPRTKGPSDDRASISADRSRRTRTRSPERASMRMPLKLVTDRSPLASREAANAGGRTLVFDFDEAVEGTDQRAPSVSPAQQENFAALFRREIENLDAWAAQAEWSAPSPFPE